MSIRINSFGGPIIWMLRKYCSNLTSKVMLNYVAKSYSKTINEYIKRFKDEENIPLFSLVNIETVNRCNGKCAFCPANVAAERRPLKKMSEETFAKIIDELAELKWRGVIFLNLNNEPLIDTNIVKRADYIRNKIGKDVQIAMITNGTLLTEEKLADLSRYVDKIIVNNYSTRYSLTEKNRLLYRYVKENALLFENTEIVIQRRFVNEILATRAGSAPNKPKKNNKIDYPCIYPFTDIAIFPDGKVGLCCNDCLEVTDFGNVNETSLMDIWHGEKFTDGRRLIGEARSMYPFCKECDVVDAGEREKWAKQGI